MVGDLRRSLFSLYANKRKNHYVCIYAKSYNMKIEKQKWVVDTIARIKIFRKVKEIFRGRLFAREDTVMLVAWALHNLKLKVKFA